MQPTSEMFLVTSALLWSLEDGGPVVAAVFKNPSEFIGRKFGITGDYKTVGEYAAVISKVTGKTVKYNQVPVEVFATFPFPGADELAYVHVRLLQESILPGSNTHKEIES